MSNFYLKNHNYIINRNPYTVAQEFLWRENLNQHFLDQVAQFIIQNSKPIFLGDQQNSFFEPFTGFFF